MDPLLDPVFYNIVRTYLLTICAICTFKFLICFSKVAFAVLNQNSNLPFSSVFIKVWYSKKCFHKKFEKGNVNCGDLPIPNHHRHNFLLGCIQSILHNSNAKGNQ